VASGRGIETERKVKKLASRLSGESQSLAARYLITVSRIAQRNTEERGKRFVLGISWHAQCERVWRFIRWSRALRQIFRLKP
jgi:hypothetical protein